MNSRWTVVATPRGKEKYAQVNLERQGFAVYCPMVRKRVKHARSVSEVLRPMFPGYLFVQIDQEGNSWRPILSTAGVRALLRSGNRPVSADKLVSALKANEGAGAPLGNGHAGGSGPDFAAVLTGLDDHEQLAALKDMLAAPRS